MTDQAKKKYLADMRRVRNRAKVGSCIAEQFAELFDKSSDAVKHQAFEVLQLSGLVNLINRMSSDPSISKEDALSILADRFTGDMDGYCATINWIGFDDIQTGGDTHIADLICDDAEDDEIGESERRRSRIYADTETDRLEKIMVTPASDIDKPRLFSTDPNKPPTEHL